MAIESGILASKKVASVTGGSRGIGKDIAHSLAGMGIGIVLTYQSIKRKAAGLRRRFKPSVVRRWRCH